MEPSNHLIAPSGPQQDLDMPTSNTKSQLELRSQSAQDVLSKKSGFIEKWALGLFILILTLLLAGSWFIHYPDTVTAIATLNARNAPKEIYSRTEGRLTKLLIRNDQDVKAGQIIGIIESTASSQEVLALSDKLSVSLQMLSEKKFREVSANFDSTYRSLGELQTAYQQFTLSLQSFNDYMVNDFYAQKAKMLQEDIHSIEALNDNFSQQLALSKQDLELSKESFDINAQLQQDKVISKEELKNYQSRLIGKKISIPVLDAALINNNSRLREKRQELNLLTHDMAQQEILLAQALQTLKSQVCEWIKRYIITAPVAGKIVFPSLIEENQFIQNNKLIAFVNPAEPRFYAEVYVSQMNSGKIDTGQRVFLRFDAYPFQEFGQVPGKLVYISGIATDSGFYSIVDIEGELFTTRRKHIQYKNGLKATVVIVTSDRSLLERLYHNIVKETSQF